MYAEGDRRRGPGGWGPGHVLFHRLGEKESLVGKPAPEVSLASALNIDRKPSVHGASGKVLLLEFWATWCPPCRASIPLLQELHDTYGKRGLLMISVTAEDERTVREFANQYKMTFPIGIDDNGRTMLAYGVRGIPTAFLIDAKGVVIWQGHTLRLEKQLIEKALGSAKG